MLQKIEVFEICYLLPGRKFKLSFKDTYFQILSQFLPTFTLYRVMKITCVYKSLKGLKYKFVFKYVLGNLVSFIGSCVKIFLKMFLVHFLLFLIQFLNE